MPSREGDAAPQATLTHLHRADGSATYAHAGYKAIGAVSGPVEVSRREEIPEEASVEVNIRPAIGVGSKLLPFFLLSIRLFIVSALICTLTAKPRDHKRAQAPKAAG